MFESVSLVASVVGSSFLLFVVGVRVYWKLRPKFPIRVNCWFCNENCDVPYNSRHSWDCPNCEQYNGFTTDGGYNKVIPEQHDELFNHSITNNSFAERTTPTVSKNRLCRKCSINQELKIQQLASFTPREPARFDEEVEEYRQHLERAYQLCNSCEQAVKQVLLQQQGWLLDQRRKYLFTNCLSNMTPLRKWWQKGFPMIWLQTCHFIATIAIFIQFLSYGSQLMPLFKNFISPDIQYFLEIASSYEHKIICLVTCSLIIVICFSQYRGRIDVASIVFWIVVLCHSWLMVLPDWSNKSFENDLKTAHVIVIILTLSVNALAAIVPRQPYLEKRLSPKIHPTGNRVKGARDITERFNSSEKFFTDERRSNDSLSFSSSVSGSPVSPSFTQDSSFMTQNSNFHCSTNSQYNENVDSALEWEFAKLNLGSSCNNGNKNISAFIKKPYNGEDSMNLLHVSNFDIEEKNNAYFNQNSLIWPAKLNFRRSVTQSSWVAGGYWQERGNTFSKNSCKSDFDTHVPSSMFTSISRSSSRSSGFHSHSSQAPASLANSCAGSLCGGDMDHISMLSEPPSQQGIGSVGDSPCFPNTKPLYVGLPYYNSLPWCFPHICAMNISSTTHNPAMLYNPQCFLDQKQVFYGSPNLPILPVSPPKPALFPVSDAHNQSSSGPGLSSRMHMFETMRHSLSRVCLVIKQNIILSVLLLGSLLINIFGFGFVLYKNPLVLST